MKGVNMNRKYRVLRFFARIQITVGVILLLAAAIALWVFTDWRIPSITLYGFAIFAGLFLSGIASISYGQFLEVIMQIEENTRQLLQGLKEKLPDTRVAVQHIWKHKP
jgi:hypothetical protein